MSPEEFLELRDEPAPEQLVSVADVEGLDRTLLLGSTCSREVFHVYLRGGLIHVLVYTTGGRGELVDHVSRESFRVSDLVPGLRVYPESTDAEFVRLLQAREQVLRFTDFDRRRFESSAGHRFHGMVKGAGRWVLEVVYEG